MKPLTGPQYKSLEHVNDPHGAVVDSYSRVLCAGVLRAASACGTYLRLLSYGLVEFRDERLFITEKGKAVLRNQKRPRYCARVRAVKS